MDVLDDEIINLWKSLYQNNVQYILIGGFATNLHGFNRITADLDIWIKDTAENRKNLKNALAKLGIDFKGIETMDFVPGWCSIFLSSGFELDIMTWLKGFDQSTFDDNYELTDTAILYDIPIKFLNLNQLIEAKKASARNKDLIDIIELEKIKKLKS
jgi:hypothetical protein